MHAFIHTQKHMHAHTTTCISIRSIYPHTFTHKFRCIHYHSGACIHTCTQIYTHARVHTLTHMHTEIHTRAAMYTDAYPKAWENMTFWDLVIQFVPLLPACLFSSTAFSSFSLWPSIKTEQAAATCTITSNRWCLCSTSMSQWPSKKAQGYTGPLASTLSSSRPFHYPAFIQICSAGGSRTGNVRCTSRRNDQRLPRPLTVIKRACTQKPCLYLSQTI